VDKQSDCNFSPCPAVKQAARGHLPTVGAPSRFDGAFAAVALSDAGAFVGKIRHVDGNVRLHRLGLGWVGVFLASGCAELCFVKWRAAVAVGCAGGVFFHSLPRRACACQEKWRRAGGVNLPKATTKEKSGNFHRHCQKKLLLSL
jgi:hypothetical protein